MTCDSIMNENAKNDHFQSAPRSKEKHGTTNRPTND